MKPILGESIIDFIFNCAIKALTWTSNHRPGLAPQDEVYIKNKDVKALTHTDFRSLS